MFIAVEVRDPDALPDVRVMADNSSSVYIVIAGTVDYARSSRGPNATGETGNNFWAIGPDLHKKRAHRLGVSD